MSSTTNTLQIQAPQNLQSANNTNNAKTMTSHLSPISPCFSDLTDKWIGDDGGEYYVMQNGNQIWWFGSNVHSTDPLAHKFIPFSNVFKGDRNVDYIHGDWQDVPMGITNGYGTLDLNVNGKGVTMTKTASEGSYFGGVILHRVGGICNEYR